MVGKELEGNNMGPLLAMLTVCQPRKTTGDQRRRLVLYNTPEVGHRLSWQVTDSQTFTLFVSNIFMITNVPKTYQSVYNPASHDRACNTHEREKQMEMPYSSGIGTTFTVPERMARPHFGSTFTSVEERRHYSDGLHFRVDE